ncbi:hypothetical protein D1157_13100, partial [Anaerotruncus sp. X29]|nr:hypothetical protein [Anaerotruncus sp. X29]
MFVVSFLDFYWTCFASLTGGFFYCKKPPLFSEQSSEKIHPLNALLRRAPSAQEGVPLAAASS